MRWLARSTLLAVALVAVPGASAESVVRVPEDQPTIQAAIAAVPNGGTIDVAGGTYSAPAPNGFALSNLGKGFTLRGRSRQTVVLDGAGSRTVLRYFNTTPASGGPFVFENLTIANGRSTTNGVAGGVTVSRGNVTFVDCRFTNNESAASSTGGGGAAIFEDSRALFLRCRFDGNRAKNEGGGLRVGGGTSGEPVVAVHASEFTGNRVNLPNHRNTAAGGGIHLTNGKIRVTNTRFESNEAGYVGGAFYALGTWQEPIATPHADAILANSTFVANRSVPDPTVTPPGPNEAGAVHAEDQATVRIYNSRFLENTSEVGGGINVYRAIVEVHDSILRGNRAGAVDAMSNFGGGVNLISNDTAADGATNRRSGSLLIEGTLLQGRYGATTTAAKAGACLHAAGDFYRRQNGFSSAQTRASLTITDSVFYDCDASATSLASGGGFDIYLANVTMSDLLVLRSDAFGSSSTGGAGRITSDSLIDLTRSTVALDTAVFIAAGLYLEGSQATIADSQFFRNDISPGIAEGEASSNGAAMFTGPVSNLLGTGQAVDMTGEVSTSVFSENVGIPVFDGDNGNGPINDLRYNSNAFYNTTFGDHVYSNSLACCLNTAALNALVVNRPGAPDTDKSQIANTALGAPATLGALSIVPGAILPTVASGDGEPTTEAFAIFTWSGGSGTFDGASVSGNHGLIEVGTGIHTLSVAGGSLELTDSAANGASPLGSISASPESIPGGASSTLQWAASSGTFLDAALDQQLGTGLPSSGSLLVSPAATTTYRLLVVTEEGGDDAEVTVFVDEGATGSIFSDGFESGGTCAWDSGCELPS